MMVTDWQEAVVISYLTGWVYCSLNDWARYCWPLTKDEIEARVMSVEWKQKLPMAYLFDYIRFLVTLFSSLFWPYYLLRGFINSVWYPLSDEDAVQSWENHKRAYRNEGLVPLDPRKDNK